MNTLLRTIGSIDPSTYATVVTTCYVVTFAALIGLTVQDAIRNRRHTLDESAEPRGRRLAAIGMWASLAAIASLIVATSATIAVLGRTWDVSVLASMSLLLVVRHVRRALPRFYAARSATITAITPASEDPYADRASA